MAVVILKTLSAQLGTTSGCHVTDVSHLGLQDIKVAIPTAVNLARTNICFVTVLILPQFIAFAFRKVMIDDDE